MINHGLNNKNLSILKKYLKTYADEITYVRLFGSRATENYQEYSDIDLALFGNVKQTTANRLYTLFNESLLPYKVDIAIYNNSNSALKKHIDDFGKVLFTKKELT